MFSDVRQAVIGQIAAAKIRPQPFPHIYIQNIFPPDFYAEIERHRLPENLYQTMLSTGRVTGDAYRARLCILDEHLAGALPDSRLEFWRDLFATFRTPEFTSAWANLFSAEITKHAAEEFPNRQGLRLSSECMLMRDLPAYALGPHTDSPLKVVSALFYLPQDSTRSDLGTSLYQPRRAGFSCRGGPHHAFKDFIRVRTMRYIPNSLFAFPKTVRSFHGVEQITDATVRRDLLLYDIKAQAA